MIDNWIKIEGLPDSRLAPNGWIANYYTEQDAKPEKLLYGCLCKVKDKVKDNLYIGDENNEPRKVENAFYQGQKIKVIWEEKDNNAEPFFTFSE